MDCKETERRISRFLANDLTGRELIQFIEHVESCESCKEELTIQYLSSEGIARLEEGKTFDLDRELTEYYAYNESGSTSCAGSSGLAY